MHTKSYHHTSYSQSHFGHAVHRFVARFAGGAAAALLFAGVVAHNAEAQVEPLGDHFIFFVDGVSLDIEEVVGAEVVDDPGGSDNKVLKLNHGQFAYHGFYFVTGDTTMGGEGAPRDLTANRDAGNVLHFRIMVDPANPGDDGQSDDIVVRNRLAIQFEDYGENIGETGNNQFRLRWAIADSLRDGEWHEVSVQLPPATWDELESGKADGSISGHESQWIYAGSWAGSFPIGLDLLGPDTAERPDLWTEFEWDNVRALGIQWDWSEAADEGAPIYLDDVFIGPADFDLGDVSGLPAAMSGVMVRADGSANVISWTHNPDFGGYNVYFSGDPITDVSAENVSLLQRVSAAPYEVRHEIEVPYSFSSSGSTLYYAVTSLSASGVENPDVSNSAVEIDNPDLAVSPPILSLTDAQSEALFNAVNSGTVSNEDFPEASMPFVVDDMHSQLSELLTLPDDNNDLSASVWVAYYGGNDAMGLSPEIWIYAEVTDDVLDFSPAADGPEGAWQYDSIELGWGNYDVRDAGGSVLGGSPHTDMERGDFPDYQFRLSPHGSATSATAKTNVAGGADNKPGIGGGAYESATDGYRILAFFHTPQVKYVGDADADFPGEDDAPRFMPFTITLNDADGGGGEPPRVHQITWSLNPTVDNNWWNTPSQWQTVTMIHSSQYVPVSSEDEPELPETYALAQNYPNPFNPATTIRFRLPKTEQVTLRVFDVLGREVAALLDNTSLGGGEHTVRFDASGLTSGVYLYRLEAGSSFVQTRRMMLVTYGALGNRRGRQEAQGSILYYYCASCSASTNP